MMRMVDGLLAALSAYIPRFSGLTKDFCRLFLLNWGGRAFARAPCCVRCARYRSFL